MLCPPDVGHGAHPTIHFKVLAGFIFFVFRDGKPTTVVLNRTSATSTEVTVISGFVSEADASRAWGTIGKVKQRSSMGND